MKGWDDALEAQNELRASFHTAQGARYMGAFTRSLSETGKTFDLDTLEKVEGRDPASAAQAVQLAVATVEHGDPMWVSGDVVELVEFAAETFQPEAIMPDDLFVPSAFGYLERPLPMIDVHGKVASYRAVSWSEIQYGDNPGARGVVICLWSHCEDKDDYSVVGLVGGSHLSLMHSGNVSYGDGRMLREPVYHGLAKQLQVLWRLAKQEVIVPGRERVSRPVWRRKSNWRQIKEVQVLRLRRAKPSKYEGPERDVEWSHRWFVHGHWRNQWYPSIQRHMQIWIDGYIKGPDDKPFIPKRRAIEFVR